MATQIKKSAITERFIELMEATNLNPKRLEDQTGIDREVWRNIKYGKQRLNADHLEALVKVWPQYAYWLVTGKELRNSGQLVPSARSTDS